MPETLTIEIVDRGQGATDRGGRPAAAPQAPSGGSASQRRSIPQTDSTERSERRARTRQVADQEERIRGAITRLEGVVGALATGRIGGAVAAGAGGLTAIAGPVGIAATAIAAALTTAVVAVRSFTRAMQSQVTELAAVSPEVALAAAATDIRRLMTQLRRGREIGPQVAAFERSRAQFEEQIADLNTQILKVMLRLADVGLPILEVVGAGVEKLTELIENAQENREVADQLTLLLQLMTGIPGLAALARRWLENQERKEQEEIGRDPFFQDFLRLAPRNPLFWAEDVPMVGDLPGDPAI